MNLIFDAITAHAMEASSVTLVRSRTFFLNGTLMWLEHVRPILSAMHIESGGLSEQVSRLYRLVP